MKSSRTHRHLGTPATCLAITLAACLCNPLVARQPEPLALPDSIEQLTAVEGISEYRLDNGLRVLLFPDPSKQTITVNITYLVGSKHEGYGETGMAHLLEHLVFKGTPRHPNIPQELTERGTRPNGTTWYDRTNYFETFAATDDNLEWALDLEADRMVNSFIAQEDLDSEMTVVRNEFEMGENYPRWVLMERMLSTAYLWHNYGKSTIGARSDIENVPIERLQRFYRRWYQPDNAVLVVAGNFDEGRTLDLIVEKFGVIPRPDRLLPEVYTSEPAQDGERSVILRRVGDLQLVGVGYHIPAGAHPDFAAADVVAHVLASTPSGRLHKTLVETGKAAAVNEFTLQLAEPGMVLFFAEVRKDRPLDEVREGMLREIELLAERPPSDEEIRRAKQSRLKDWETTMRDSERAALQLSEWAAMGDWRLMFLHRDRLRAVTPAEVRRVATTYLTPINRTLGLYLPTDEPQRAQIPPTPDVAALLADYQGGEALSAGETFDPTPAAIEGRVVRSTLPSGLRLVMLPKETRGDLVHLALRLHLGDLESLVGRSRAGELAARMLMRGTESRSRQEIQDELDRLEAQLLVSGSATGVEARLEVSRSNLDPALALLTEILRQPSFPASEYEQLREEELAGLEESKTDPFRLAFTAFYRHLDDYPPGDPRRVLTPEEAIAATAETDLEQVVGFYREFYGASAGELAVVGDCDPGALERRVDELLGRWESPRPYHRIPTPYAEAPSLSRTIETPDKESAVFIAGLPIPLRDTQPDYPAMVLGNFMTGGGFLSSRLATRLRQQEGLSYGVRSRFSASSWEDDATFMTYAIYAPQNAAAVETAFDEEIDRILADGFTAEEITAAKRGWLQQRRVSRSQEDELAALLADLEHRDRRVTWEAELEAGVEALSGEEIAAAMRRRLDPDRMTVIKAGDFARLEGAAAASEAGAESPSGRP